jgi:hypothetical protein
MAVKHVHGSTVSLNGCKVEIDGDVVYALIPPHIIGFRGAVHISGGPGCPNGDLYFGDEADGGSANGPPVDKHQKSKYTKT